MDCRFQLLWGLTAVANDGARQYPPGNIHIERGQLRRFFEAPRLREACSIPAVGNRPCLGTDRRSGGRQEPAAGRRLGGG